MKNRSICLAFSLVPLSVASLFAQERPGKPPAEFEFFTSSSSSSATRAGGKSQGDLGLSFFNAKVDLGSTPLARGALTYSLTGSLIGIDRSGHNPLPSSLAGAGLSTSYFQVLSPQTSLIASVTVGAYGSGFNAQAVSLVNWKQQENLTWSAGLAVDAQSRYPVLPFFGVAWQVNPEWALVLGAPRTGVSYTPSENLQLDFGLSMAGGTYRTGSLSVGNSGLPNLSNTWAEVREIRVGPALRWKLNESIDLHAEVGWVANREIEFDDRDITFRSDDAGYAGLGLTYRF